MKPLKGSRVSRFETVNKQEVKREGQWQQGHIGREKREFQVQRKIDCRVFKLIDKDKVLVDFRCRGLS